MWFLKIFMRFIISLLFAARIYSFVVGNPAQPDLTLASLIRTDETSWALRIAYVDDYIYALHVQDEFDFGPSNEKPPLVRFSTDAAWSQKTTSTLKPSATSCSTVGV